MKPTTHEWVKKAENDFKVASQILARRKDVVVTAAGAPKFGSALLFED